MKLFVSCISCAYTNEREVPLERAGSVQSWTIEPVLNPGETIIPRPLLVLETLFPIAEIPTNPLVRLIPLLVGFQIEFPTSEMSRALETKTPSRAAPESV